MKLRQRIGSPLRVAHMEAMALALCGGISVALGAAVSAPSPFSSLQEHKLEARLAAKYGGKVTRLNSRVSINQTAATKSPDGGSGDRPRGKTPRKIDEEPGAGVPDIAGLALAV